MAKPHAALRLHLLAVLRLMLDLMVDMDKAAVDIWQRLNLVLEVLREIVCLPEGHLGVAACQP